MITSLLFVGIMSGLLFAFMDALINANPLAVRLNAAYKPIARTSIVMPAALILDILYGVLMAGIFALLYPSLPGGGELLKGLSFGLMVWFFRVAMQVGSQWVMFTVPGKSLLYTAAAGLGEMLVLGLFYALTLPLVL